MGCTGQPGPGPICESIMRIYDPHDKDPARRFKAALLNEGFAVSPDGVQWTKLDLPAIPSSDGGNFSYDPSEALFIHSVKRGGPFGRSVAIATSRDFNTWRDYGVVFHADELDPGGNSGCYRQANSGLRTGRLPRDLRRQDQTSGWMESGERRSHSCRKTDPLALRHERRRPVRDSVSVKDLPVDHSFQELRTRCRDTPKKCYPEGEVSGVLLGTVP